MASETVKSTCGFCLAGCGVLVTVEDGKVVDVKGDPDHPTNKGALCVVGNSSLEYLQSPERLTRPLKRVGNRGEGKWQSVSWDEALDRIADEFNQVKEKHGAESVAFMQGCSKGYSDSHLSRLANVFGSANVASMSYICFHSKLRGMLHTYGFMARPDYEHPPGCIVLWGVNPPASNFPEGLRIVKALDKGSKLMIIDPGETTLTGKADLWVKPRPGSDLALALAMINVIISEKLFDRDFVDKWTVGFKELAQHVKDYTPEKVSEITWVPQETIKEMARFYATNKPACMISGNGLENNLNNFQFSRAASILRALTGNIGVPGGDIEIEMPHIMWGGGPELHRWDLISPELRARRVGGDLGMMPNYFSAHPPSLVKAMLTSDPYPVRAAFIQGGSLLHTYTNTREVFKAFEGLDFLAVSDLFLTPTAELADIVLPVGTYLEIDDIFRCESSMYSIAQKVTQVGESWSDCKIINELGKHLGLGEYFWENEEEVLDFILKPYDGLTFKEFRKIGVLEGEKRYYHYKEKGFHTPSGKVELYSQMFKEWGFDPLPVYREPLDLLPINQGPPDDYPLILTSMKQSPYIHSRGRQIPSLRNRHPDPIVKINSDTAEKLGIRDGDWVYIENSLGKVREKAALTPDIHPQTVIADFGWWFPEKKEDLHGWAESNLGTILDNNPPYAREIGSVILKGVRCKVYKAS
ncbi:MAG: molybdopterin-dependent oxidoreductase [Syntrophaceae bacterium]|nr:molybdopterin-dependent oxidoreductase [Syntrophaceae bacterium]